MCAKSRTWLDIMQKLLTKDDIEVSIGTIQDLQDGIQVQIVQI